MGFIDRATGIDNFAKAVISFRFRVPQESLDAARAQYVAANVTDANANYNLPGIVPLLTFGPTDRTYDIYDGLGAIVSSGAVSPCVIGVACGESYFGSEVFQNVLYCRLQYASGERSVGAATSVYSDYFQVGAKMSPCTFSSSLTDGSFISVSADTWHHVLISFDLSGGCSTTSIEESPGLSFDTLCSFYWAFDDVNYNSEYLWPDTPIAAGADDVPNGIVSDICMGGATFSAGSLPTSGKEMGIPSSTSNAGFINQVEMSDIQVFTGVTLDLGVESNRRAFVSATGRPVSPSLAATLLGKSPEILFQTSADWITGNNRGTAGNFNQTGTITEFTPSP